MGCWFEVARVGVEFVAKEAEKGGEVAAASEGVVRVRHAAVVKALMDGGVEMAEVGLVGRSGGVVEVRFSWLVRHWP